MARKPVDLIAKSKHPQGRQAIWEVIRKNRRFTLDDLSVAINGKKATIASYVRALHKAGYLERHQMPADKGRREVQGFAKDKIVEWELKKDVGVDAPVVRKDGTHVVQGSGREQMWRTMKIIGDFSWRELAVQASTDSHKVAEQEARDYCQFLHRAKYLRCIDDGGPGRPARYRFIARMFTGPKPPMIQRVKQVFDPNLQKVMWPTDKEVADECMD